MQWQETIQSKPDSLSARHHYDSINVAMTAQHVWSANLQVQNIRSNEKHLHVL